MRLICPVLDEAGAIVLGGYLGQRDALNGGRRDADADQDERGGRLDADEQVTGPGAAHGVALPARLSTHELGREHVDPAVAHDPNGVGVIEHERCAPVQLADLQSAHVSRPRSALRTGRPGP